MLHLFQIKSKTDEPVYECVVATPCLYDTKNKFTVHSDEMGFNAEDLACESAAKNALRLLGLEDRRPSL